MIYFGTGGVPVSAEDRSTEGGIRKIFELELDAMEIEFVRGVKMKENKAKGVRETAEATGVLLTAHAPYYINLASEEKFDVSVERIINTVRIGNIAGVRSVVFHAAYYGKDRKRAYKMVKKGIKEVMKFMKHEGIELDLRVETTGKPSQFGEVDEILSLCEETGCRICVDFAHIHARTGGKYNSYEEFMEIFEKIEKRLGKEELSFLHMHVSGIDYDERVGEKEHLNLRDSDFNWKDLLRALKDKGVGGVIIVESPNLEEDAMLLKSEWKKMGGEG